MQSVEFAINEIIIESLKEINSRLVREALAEWESYGEGCFQKFLRWYVALRWSKIVEVN